MGGLTSVVACREALEALGWKGGTPHHDESRRSVEIV